MSLEAILLRVISFLQKLCWQHDPKSMRLYHLWLISTHWKRVKWMRILSPKILSPGEPPTFEDPLTLTLPPCHTTEDLSSSIWNNAYPCRSIVTLWWAAYLTFLKPLRGKYYVPLPFLFDRMQEILPSTTSVPLKWNLELKLMPK